MERHAPGVISRAVFERLDRAQSLDEFQALIPVLQEAFQVDHVVYHWVSVDGGQFGFGSYDPAWAQLYADRDYIRIDPVVQACIRSFEPVDWKTLDWSSKSVRDLRAEAARFGIGPQGLSVPIRGPSGQFSLFTVSHDCSATEWDDFIAARQNDLTLLAHQVNGQALRAHAERAPEPIALLSPRELDALSYLGMGYARSQAAELMSISEHTLRSYIEGARRKLGALNTTHAVARGVAEGLILSGGAARGAGGRWPGQSVADPAFASSGAAGPD